MHLPHGKRSIAPRLNSMPGNLCRLQRRKLALRHKSAGPSRAISILNSETNQVLGRPRLRDSALMIDEKSIEQSYARDTFLQAIVEACAANVAVLDESGNILYVSKPWRLSAEKYGPQGGRHPFDLNYLERRNGPNGKPSNHTSALAEDMQAILDSRIRAFHNEYSCPNISGSSWFVVHAARL